MSTNKPNLQTPQHICPKSHNAIFRAEMCIFLFCMVHCGIWDRCIVGFVTLVYWWNASSGPRMKMPYSDLPIVLALCLVHVNFICESALYQQVACRNNHFCMALVVVVVVVVGLQFVSFARIHQNERSMNISVRYICHSTPDRVTVAGLHCEVIKHQWLSARRLLLLHC